MNETRSHQRHDAQQGAARQADDGCGPGRRSDVCGALKRPSTRSWLLLKPRLAGSGQQRGVVANAKSGRNNKPCSGGLQLLRRLKAGLSRSTNTSCSLRYNEKPRTRRDYAKFNYCGKPAASRSLWRRHSQNPASSPRLIAVRGSGAGCRGRWRISTMQRIAQSRPVLSQRNSAKPNWRAGSSNVPHGHGRPSPNSQGVRAVAGLSRQPHAHPLARQTRRAMPGWAALQGAGQQHGRSLHGVDRIAHSRAGVGAAALSLGMQRDRSREHGVGAAGVAARRLCRGGEVSKRRLGASLAASAEHGGHEQP